MSHRRVPARPRPRLAALALAVLALAAVVVGPAPAGASPAPLLTQDGLGVRIDEAAFTPAVMADVEAAIDPLLHDVLYDGAVNHFGITNFVQLTVTYDLDLTVDFVPPGPGGANGTVVLAADVTNTSFEYLIDPVWPFADCHIWVRPDPVVVDAEAPVTPAALPDNPLVAGPGTATWATANPAVSSDGVCWTYIVWAAFDWVGFSDLGNPTSPASQTVDLLEDALADLADVVWDDNVLPMVTSLEVLAGFNVAFGQIRADDHGLIVTADVDGSSGVTVSGSGPYPVGGAINAGATSNINSLLAQRALGGVPSHIIVSLHPNVTNQYYAALTTHLNSGFGTTTVSDAIRPVLVDIGIGTCYDPGGWTTHLSAQAPPHITPSGAGGAPELQLSAMTFQVRNPGCDPGDPRVATFSGSMDSIEVTSTGSPLGPRGSAATAQWAATRTQADAATDARIPPATDVDLRLWARGSLATFLGVLVPDHVDLAPGGFPGWGAVHCTTCGRYPGDQRITETFHI